MEVRTQQVIYGVAEVIAAHNLLHYVRNDAQKLRMATGAGMAALGYVFGPELEQRIRNIRDEKLNERFKEQLVYSAGGAVLGALAGYSLGPSLYKAEIIKSLPSNETVSAPTNDAKPGGLITIASAGWLGYSLFFDGKNKDEQKRHLWGLGSGVIGYMYGPEMLHKIKNMTIPASASNDAIALYARGSAAIGTIAGGVLGWYKGKDLVNVLGGK